MIDVDQAIGQVERLYRGVVGRDAPPLTETPYAAIPPEKDPEQHVEEQLDRLLSLLGPAQPQQAQAQGRWIPRITLWEGSQEYLLCVDLPGVPRDAVNVSLTQSQLTISGERSGPDGTTELLTPRWQEEPIGPFVRVVMLPQGALAEQLQAQMKDGVLEIRIPRISIPVAAKPITVQ